MTTTSAAAGFDGAVRDGSAFDGPASGRAALPGSGAKGVSLAAAHCHDADFGGARWRKSTHSGNGGNCVEVAVVNGVIGVRDSKNPAGAVLRFTPAEWSAFVHGVHDGEFDL